MFGFIISFSTNGKEDYASLENIELSNSLLRLRRYRNI